MLRRHAQNLNLRIPDTFHFNIGNVAAGLPTLGTPGVASAAAMSFFGQINIRTPRRLAVNHIHIIDDGVGSVFNMELWRRRSGVMTRLTQVTYTAGVGDFATIGATPATDDLAFLNAGDYLFAQFVTGSVLGATPANGLTFDVHYAY